MAKCNSASRLSSVGVGGQRIDDQLLLQRMRRQPPRHVIGRKQQRPVDCSLRADAGAEQECESPPFLSALPAIGKTSDAWLLGLQVILLRMEAVAPVAAEALVLEARELRTYPELIRLAVTPQRTEVPQPIEVPTEDRS